MEEKKALWAAWEAYRAKEEEFASAFQSLMAGDEEARARACALLPERQSAWEAFSALFPVQEGP